jgi:hypothetical protein
MAILVVCDECSCEYQVDAKHAGRKFRCKHCGTAVTVPGTMKKAGSSPPSSTTKKPAPSKKAAASEQPAPPTRKPKPRPKPAVEQPQPDDEWEDYGEDNGEEELELPPAKSTTPKKSKKSKKKRKSAGSPFGALAGGNWVTTLGAVSAIALVLLLALSFVHQGFALLFAICTGLISVGLLLVGGIWSLVIPFRESVVCGLCYLFVPFYALYYLISRWDEMWKPWVMQIGASVMLLLLAVIMPFFQSFHHQP